MRTLTLLSIALAACSSSDPEKFPNGSIVGEGEGEDEISSEGEGEIIAEGEGEAIAEGEGEIPTEGEGEGEALPCECEENADCVDETVCNGEETCVACMCVAGEQLDCSDSLECTDERCDPVGGCLITPVHARCPDQEACHPLEGCKVADPCRTSEDCAIEDACQVGVCEESSRTCIFSVLDGDADDHPPRVCGGEDCNDNSADAYPDAPELCNNQDDDCDGEVDEEFDLTSNEHCGECNNTCLGDIQCANGSCSECEGDNTIVCSVDGQDACVRIGRDEDNCGACGNRCPQNVECVNSVCRCRVEGETACSGECLNLSTDHQNCGGCGVQCEAFERCIEGNCECVTDVFRNDCNGNCIVCGGQCWPSDEQNCGRCGNICPDRTQCVNGIECGCETYFNDFGEEVPCDGQCVVCDGTCRNLSNNIENCGECGLECDPDKNCNQGECECILECDGQCVHPFDPENCGQCDESCVDSQPELGCSSEFGDWEEALEASCMECDEDLDMALCPDDRGPQGSICANLMFDTTHCGDCNSPCDDDQACAYGECYP